MMNWLDKLHKRLNRSDIYFGLSLYMRRWRLGPRQGLGLRLHNIVRGDSHREFHDHPFSFVSIILWGGYTEHRPDHPPEHYGPGSIIFRRATDLHRLDLSQPAWTLVIRGPVHRKWGFLTENGWVPWDDFIAQREASVGDGGTPGAYAAPSSVGMAEVQKARQS